MKAIKAVVVGDGAVGKTLEMNPDSGTYLLT